MKEDFRDRTQHSAPKGTHPLLLRALSVPHHRREALVPSLYGTVFNTCPKTPLPAPRTACPSNHTPRPGRSRGREHSVTAGAAGSR